MIYRMKVTALIPDLLVRQLREHSSGKNLTEALTVALKEWLALKKVRGLNHSVAKSPLRFRKGFSASKIRDVNRSR